MRGEEAPKKNVNICLSLMMMWFCQSHRVENNVWWGKLGQGDDEDANDDDDNNNDEYDDDYNSGDYDDGDDADDDGDDDDDRWWWWREWWNTLNPLRLSTSGSLGLAHFTWETQIIITMPWLLLFLIF